MSFEAGQIAAKVRLALARRADASNDVREAMAEANALAEKLGSAAPAVLLDAMRAAAEDNRQVPDSSDLPHWDCRHRVLSVGGRTVKRYRVPSANQEAVLDAFQREGWPHRIDDPLPYRANGTSKNRLHYTLNHMNQSQREHLVRFFGDGTGEGACWELLEAASFSLPQTAAVLQKPRRAA